MNISFNWLKQYIDFEFDTSKLAGYLTGCGLEVESVEPFESVKGGLNGLIVGEVLQTSKHPNADRLTVTRVNLGGDKVAQIVCGAPNVASGQKVIVASPGTTIFPLKGDPFEIKNSKIRGEASEGMICAEDEIGLGTNHDGIMVLPDHVIPGTPITEYIPVEHDFTLSIGLTPNRPDAASHIGVARDLLAVMNASGEFAEKSLLLPDISAFVESKSEPKIQVELTDEACTRYSGLHITGVKVGPSPAWLQNRLMAVGLKPVNNVVDVTNFVLYEYGQPLHAFDAANISGNKVIVKRLSPETRFITLDGIERKLKGTELMICDNSGGMCIAGVFGGINSGITESTTEVFLESACFDPVSIRKTSKLHGLKTDASFRFERGTDPNITLTALKRAAQLLTEITGGTPSSAIIDIYPRVVPDWKIDFLFSGFAKHTGIEIDKLVFNNILTWLDIKVTGEKDGVISLEVPPYRVDVMREVDIVEEVLRIYGYHRVPFPSKMNTSLPQQQITPLEKHRNSMAAWLVSNGFNEVMSNSLYRSSVFSTGTGMVKIMNPLSIDLDIMRPDMLHPLLDIALYNANRKRQNLRLFEFGKTYHRQEDGYNETNHLALLVTGDRNEKHWKGINQPYDVYYLKSIVENLVGVCVPPVQGLQWGEIHSNHLGQCMALMSGNFKLAVVGEVDKLTLKAFGMDIPAWYIDMDLDALMKTNNKVKLKIDEPPRFPEVRRDLSMVLDKTVQYQALEELAYQTERKLLKGVNLFDVFEGDKIGSGKKSYALSFVLRDSEKTLTEKEIEKVMHRLMGAFEEKLGAVIRKA